MEDSVLDNSRVTTHPDHLDPVLGRDLRGQTAPVRDTYDPRQMN